MPNEQWQLSAGGIMAGKTLVLLDHATRSARDHEAVSIHCSKAQVAGLRKRLEERLSPEDMQFVRFVTR